MEDIKQITKYKGEDITVELRNGLVIRGVLAFYNINDQSIHVSNYQQLKQIPNSNRLTVTESGDLAVLNKYSWSVLKAGKQAKQIKNAEENENGNKKN